MEFWGVEVKSGEPLSVEPGDGMVLHLSQANIGEAKKDRGAESICIFVTVGGKKLVLATLNTEKLPQQQFDLVFDRDFEISHNWKNGSVFFYGYLATNPMDELTDEDDDEFESVEDIPLHANNGKPDTKSKPEKPATAEKANATKDSASGKQKVKIVEPKKDAKDEDEDESSDEDMDDDNEDSETGEDEDGSDSEDEDSEDEESEETPKKVETGKKRPAESAKKTPVPDKKVKMATQKTDGKKGSEHVATPHPSKKPGKTLGNKANQQTPKSGGSHQCKSCNRSFGSESALDSHSKAKHGAGK